MIYRIILPYAHDEAALERAVYRQAGGACVYRVLKRSIDARQHRNIKVEYSVSTDTADPVERIRDAVRRQRSRAEACFTERSRPRPVVVGSGPGGIFCALWLRMHGFTPLLLEQGPPLRQRVRDMARFMKRGELEPHSNICFGAGGAGTYSDGKLITRIRSPFISFVMSTFVDYGAPEQIRAAYNPHLGSNLIRRCISLLLDAMAEGGVDIRYNTRLADFDHDAHGRIERLIFAGTRSRAGDPSRGVGGGTRSSASVDSDAEVLESQAALFLASGHSSRDTYAMLRRRGVEMASKDFAVGIRVEHPAHEVNVMQYGSEYDTRYPGIETAQYRLAKTWKDEQRAVYSFCMCPGGYVLNASTGADGVVTNGMSNHLKSGRFSNAAMVVNVSQADLARMGYEGTDAALLFQRDVEERFRAAVNVPGSSAVVPGQRLADFLEGTTARALHASSCLNPTAPAALHTLLPDFVTETLRRGFPQFERKMQGFATHEKAQIFGAETRTSSPYRVLRDPLSLASPTHPNLYPVGEGAGYAGGITSAAVDGIRCAQAWLSTFVEVETFGSQAESQIDESE